jgi:molybdopterin/thiamine biosynthesis adenylyltransferase
VGTSGIEAVADDKTRLAAVSVEVLGEWKLEQPVAGARSRFSVDVNETDSSALEEQRYDRNMRAFGTNGQRRLESTTVGLVGVGGLGSMIAEQLARLGVGELVVVDPDNVEESNLSRIVGVFDHHVGEPKVTAIRDHLLKSSGGSLAVTAVQERIQDCPSALDDCDIVIGCVDSVTARSFCNEYAVKQLQYYLDAGVRIDTPEAPAGDGSGGTVAKQGSEASSGDTAEETAKTDDRTVEMTGYVHLVAPGSNACFDCLGRHDQAAARIEQLSPTERGVEQERGYIDDGELTPEPAVVHLNGQCASKAVSVLVDLVTGVHTPPDFIRYEDHSHEMTELTTAPSEGCPTCGTDGVLGVGHRSFGDARFEPAEKRADSD